MTNLKDRTIVFIATVPWSYNWQRQHEWTSRFAVNNKVIFIQPFGMNNIGPIKIIKKLFERRHKGTFEHQISERVKNNLTIVQPRIIPWHNVKMINLFNGWLFSRQIKKLSICPAHELVFWICNPADTVLYILRRFNKTTVIYDIAMRFLKRTDCPAYLKSSQAALARRADFIISDSKASISDLPIDTHRKVSYVPQGINSRMFQKVDPLNSIKNIKGTKIIYLGANHDSLDVKLLNAIVDTGNQYHLLLTFNKPETNNQSFKDLENNPSVHFLGPLQFEKINAVLQAADIGIIPYKINEFTEGVFPTKMFEYLANRLPVVSTALPELIQYENKILIAKNNRDFILKLEQARNKPHLNLDDQFLKKQTWEERFKQVAKLFDSHLLRKDA